MANKVITINIGEDLHKDAQDYIIKNKKKGYTLSFLIRKILIDYLEEQKFYDQENQKTNV